MDMVITSHFHYDHIGYLGLFDRAQVVSGQKEYDYWFSSAPRIPSRASSPPRRTWSPSRKPRRRAGCCLISGEEGGLPRDHGLPGGRALSGRDDRPCRDRKRPLILASDAAHFYEQLEHGWPFFAFTDFDEMSNCLALHGRSDRAREAQVIPGHDGRTAGNGTRRPGPRAQSLRCWRKGAGRGWARQTGALEMVREVSGPDDNYEVTIVKYGTTLHDEAMSTSTFPIPRERWPDRHGLFLLDRPEPAAHCRG